MQKGIVEQFGDFAPDENFLTLASVLICVFGIKSFLVTTAISKWGCPKYHRVPLYVTTLGTFVLLWLAARFGATKEVRENSAYLMLTVLIGGAYLTLSASMMSFLGISFRDDAFERRNFAAILSLSGAVLGAMLIYTGSNLGEGPSFWINLFCSALGFGTWLALWLCLEISTNVSRAVTEERDVAAGLRLGCFLIAEGLVLARALMGDWHSASATVKDFVGDGWPAGCLVLIAIGFELYLKPGVARPFPPWKTLGLPPGLLYVIFALGWLWHLGWWEGAPR